VLGMINRQVKLDKEQTDQLIQLDRSITHWSVEHSKAVMQARGLLSNLEGLYQARQNLLENVYKAAGIQPGAVVQSRIQRDGTIQVICNEEPAPKPEDSPPNGTETDPAPPPADPDASSTTS